MRPIILSICYIMSIFLPSMPKIRDIFKHLQHLGLGNVIEKLPKEDIRQLCVAMHKKYHSEIDHDKYIEFLGEAGMYIRYHQGLFE